MNLCAFPGCGRPRHSRGLCSTHRKQRDAGAHLTPIWEPRSVLVHPTDPLLSLIPLAPDPDGQRFAIVDACVAEVVARFSWRPDQRPNGPAYVRGKVNGHWKYLHVFLWTLWGLPTAQQIDHRNRDGLDCRRENLRAATTAQNQANTASRKNSSSRYKGVTWHRAAGRWQAAIKSGGKNRYLGLFASEDDAGKAYDKAAQVKYGEFALLNFNEAA